MSDECARVLPECEVRERRNDGFENAPVVLRMHHIQQQRQELVLEQVLVVRFGGADQRDGAQRRHQRLQRRRARAQQHNERGSAFAGDLLVRLRVLLRQLKEERGRCQLIAGVAVRQARQFAH